ncbi:MAG: ribonuclease HII [Chthonomonadales bacterium]
MVRVLADGPYWQNPLKRSPKEPVDLWRYERASRERGLTIIAGIDEAGRGPLAGPVVAAAVVLPFEVELPGVDDSKKLTPDQRERAYDLIQSTAISIGIGYADAEKIDNLNILRATHAAMRDAVMQISPTPTFALIDGLPVHPFPVLQQAIVKGDSNSASIAAASIIAKVTRDRLMVEMHALYPQYEFAGHKGYPSALHLELLKQHGPCPIHRRSYAPVAAAVAMHATEPALIEEGQALLDLGMDNATVGESGEEAATRHLIDVGMNIVERNFRCAGGEIDIVAEDGGSIVFVEVKTRRSKSIAPSTFVDFNKQSRLAVAAETWLLSHGGLDRKCRFDVAEVYLIGGSCRVHLIRNAFEVMGSE